ncbi:MAG: hypothetical protein LBV52_00075 [Spirochaetaceae bacterium]|jgi:hypothetical protein|nr:hypothetical protein [Spirochaetaceae bacterium]
MEIVLDNVKDGYTKSPNCLKCKYFKVSWDINFPRICTLFNIKCRSLPSAEVYNATRTQCPSFELKEGLK